MFRYICCVSVHSCACLFTITCNSTSFSCGLINIQIRNSVDTDLVSMLISLRKICMFQMKIRVNSILRNCDQVIGCLIVDNGLSVRGCD